MWDLTNEVQWWEEWQLRILVLGSLFLQLVLFIGSIARHARSLKLVMWFAYLGADADALAIYALTTLFNRHKQPAGSGDANAMRLEAAILLFIAGILKFIQKVWALSAASFSSLMTTSLVYPQRRAQRMDCLFRILHGRYGLRNDSSISLREEEELDMSLEEYIRKAKQVVRMTHVYPNELTSIVGVRRTMQFVDLSAPFIRRLSDMSSFLKHSPRDKSIRMLLDLGFSFFDIYTNNNLIANTPILFLRLLFPFMSLASTLLFCQSHKDSYKESDIRVTYILLWCITVLEFLPFLLSPCFVGAAIWSATAAQHNVISFSSRRGKPTKLMRVSAILGLKDYTNKHWYIHHESDPVCTDIINLVFKHLKQRWEEFIEDATTYKRFSNFRGQLTMSRHQVRDSVLSWSLQVPFDLSVLVWHVATELCLHHPNSALSSATANNAAQDQSTSSHRCSKVISDYMIYLLFIRSEMLLPGTRQGLFTIISDDIEIMLKCASETPSRDTRTVTQQILRAARFPEPYANQIGPWILEACKLAEGQMELPDEEERWNVIQGVWVEMLCYSAGRCRGYLHAKSMGEGVEFLTHIRLLLGYMGMETLADKLQRPEPTAEEVDATLLQVEEIFTTSHPEV